MDWNKLMKSVTFVLSPSLDSESDQVWLALSLVISVQFLVASHKPPLKFTLKYIFCPKEGRNWMGKENSPPKHWCGNKEGLPCVVPTQWWLHTLWITSDLMKFKNVLVQLFHISIGPNIYFISFLTEHLHWSLVYYLVLILPLWKTMSLVLYV